MKENKKHQVFILGPIKPEFISDSIAKHQSKINIGAHQIFLGQVRADVLNGKTVTAIDYKTYEEMAEEQFYQIRENAFKKFDLTCLHIYHSLGRIKAGEICLFVFTSAPHRVAAFEGCSWIVEEIKSKVPIWGKEIMEDESFLWKKNNQA